MTKVLDILEQFLNIHGHKYLRLDGSTKIEQRQILTDRFNNDTRILAFILSSRSGGLGINLTGADTVIFYDLDWNPAMDKQCQDRCHRIGQTRDVHIYRLVSEHTIEANILRKANQKRMLDDVVIQEGEFTTDYFNKMSVRDVIGEDPDLLDGDAAANAAMDRVLGGPDSTKDVSRVLAQAEDVEDVAAAKVAAREDVQMDAADFDENAVTASATPAGPGTPRDGVPTPAIEGTPVLDDAMDIDGEDEVNAWGQQIQSTDEYMLQFMADQLKDTPVELPKDKNRSKRGKDHRSRSHRVR
jgi:helicase SWR1